jgi:hypothetical protein
MAAQSWIESADHKPKPPTGGQLSGTYHLLALAHQDEKRAAAERDRAGRLVARKGGEHAGELLIILGLADEPETPSTRVCGRCGETKDAAEMVPDRRRPDGLSGICHGCFAAARASRAKRPVASGRHAEEGAPRCGR